jgi:hypothetical protein
MTANRTAHPRVTSKLDDQAEAVKADVQAFGGLLDSSGRQE